MSCWIRLWEHRLDVLFNYSTVCEEKSWIGNVSIYNVRLGKIMKICVQFYSMQILYRWRASWLVKLVLSTDCWSANMLSFSECNTVVVCGILLLLLLHNSSMVTGYDNWQHLLLRTASIPFQLIVLYHICGLLLVFSPWYYCSSYKLRSTLYTVDICNYVYTWYSPHLHF